MSQLTLKDKKRLKQPEMLAYCLFVASNKFIQSLTDKETVQECKKIRSNYIAKMIIAAHLGKI